MPARKVLIADPDVAASRALTRALRRQQYHVHHAADGSKALELAVLRHPDVVLFDDECTLIDAKSFAAILLSNPRTADIPVVVTSRTPEDVTTREEPIKKPYDLDEVVNRVDGLCRRVEAGRELRGDVREIEGGLGQLPLTDLLQILATNRRTGRLTLLRGRERGELHLANGRPVNAVFGELEGEKAFFRLVGWRDGTFAFIPGPPALRTRIDRAMEDMLLEGMRQTDERARLLDGLPPVDQVLALSPDAAEPVEPHPVTAAVLQTLALPRRLREVLDAVDAPDLEILSALTALLQRNIIRHHEGAGSAEGPLLPAAEAYALKSRLMRGKPTRNALVGKVIVCGSGSKAGRWLLRGVPGLLTDTTREPPCLRSGFGTLGRLEVSDVLKVDLVLVPPAEAARPLWRPFCSGAVGALVMEEGEAVLKLARFCAFELKLPIVIAARAASNGLVTSEVMPPTLRDAPMGANVVSHDIAHAIRTLLVAAMQTPSGDMPEGVMVRRAR